MGVYPESFLAPMRQDIAALDARIARARPEGDSRIQMARTQPKLPEVSAAVEAR
jgi:NADH-quinone oxidoreductase subunit M